MIARNNAALKRERYESMDRPKDMTKFRLADATANAIGVKRDYRHVGILANEGQKPHSGKATTAYPFSSTRYYCL
jgi:hypothetical protein